MAYYRRRLPHWHPAGKFLFITWRLFDSLPKSPRSPNEADKPVRAGERFRSMDRQLDTATDGPLWLRDERIARIVVDSLQYAEESLELYDLLSWVVMPNHVHVLLYPYTDLNRITRAVKSFSARKSNETLGRTGRPFWQDESFDHWIRSRKDLEGIGSYIEQNPVKAGLVSSPEKWPWSSANPQYQK